MFVPKRTRRLISFFLSFLLLFQSIAPTLLLAQEVALDSTPSSVIAIPSEVEGEAICWFFSNSPLTPACRQAGLSLI